MYITRMPLNPARRGAWKLLSSPQAMHAAVLSGFPPAPPAERGRVLWRVDRSAARHDVSLALVSPTPPDLTALVEQAGWPMLSTWDTRDYAAFLGRIAEGQRWRFRLTANPVHVVTGEDGIAKRLPHVTVARQQQWFLERAEQNGFAMAGREDGPGPVVTRRERSTFRRGSGQVTLVTAQFDGVLVVRDARAFRTALTQGIGRAKAYGCGLMTLASADG